MPVQTPDFPISSAAYLTPFVKFFDDLGSPWQRALAKEKLPSTYFDTDCLPSVRIVRFITDLSLREGVNDIGLQLPQTSDMAAIHPELRRQLASASSLFEALQVACRHCDLQGSHLRIWTTVVDNYLWICHSGSIDASLTGVEQFEWFRIARLLELVRRFLGFAWNPAYLHVFTKQYPSTMMQNLVGGCEVNLGCAYGVVPVELTLFVQSLAQPTETADSLISLHADWLENIQKILPAYLDIKPITVDLLSDLTGMSTRSLQRALADRGSSFARLIEDAKFSKAKKILLSTDLPLMEIAAQCGFTDKSNFSRFFRRMAGCSPNQLREFGVK